MAAAARFLYRHTLGAMVQQLRTAAGDYAAVLREMGADIRARPLRAAALTGTLCAAGYVCSIAPSERDYLAQLAEAETDLIDCGDRVKSAALQHVRSRRELLGRQQLHYVYLGPVALVMAEDEGREVRTFAATYWTWPQYVSHLRGRILDVGVCRHWIYLERAMENYDLVDG
jgi:hypothetical protein